MELIEENEAITFHGISFSSSKQQATKYNQQFITSKLGRHTSSRETRIVTSQTKRKPLEMARTLVEDLVMEAINSCSNSKAYLKGNTSEESSLLIGDNIRHLRVGGIPPRPLTSSCCATWLAVTRQGDWVVRDLSDCWCCCRPTSPCIFGGVLPYFEVTGHPVPVSSLGF